MAEDLAKLIESLNTARSLLGEDIYHAKLAQLRTAYGDRAVDDVLRADRTGATGGTTQIITESAKVGVAARDIYGGVYINGQWTRDEATLVRRYLGQLIAR